MSAQLLYAFDQAAFAAVLFWTCQLQLKTGRSGIPGFDAWVERAKHPFDYWAYFTTCLLAAGGFAAAAARNFWLIGHGQGSSKAADAEDWFAFAVVALVLGLMLFVTWGIPLWRRGNPLVHGSELRREAGLRRSIKALVADPKEQCRGMSIDEFAAHADLGWLEEIVAHLEGQEEPRTLARAIDATNPPA